MNMDKKYTIGLSVSHDGNREMNIETNDLQDLFQADWFRQFLMSKTSAPIQQVPVQQVRDDTADLQLQLATDEINRLQQQLTKMKSQQQQMQQQMQEISQEKPIPKLDGAVQSIMPDLQKQMQQSQQQQQSPSPMPPPPRPAQQPRRLPASFLELDPNNMTEAIWNSLTAEQQQQWLAYYKIA